MHAPLTPPPPPAFPGRSALSALLLCAPMFLHAQQNFFNVPSADITPKGKVFFQEQFNIAAHHQQSSTTIDLGLGHGLEAGLNCNGLTVLEDRTAHPVFNDTILPYNPFLLANAQERIELGADLALALGGQFGGTLTRAFRSGGMAWCTVAYHSAQRGLKCVAGPYYASKSYFGEGERLFGKVIGLQAGIEKTLIPERLVLQADLISGKHDLGEAVPGAAYFLTRHWVLSAGYQLPTFGSTSTRSLVFELTYAPSS